MTGNNDTGTDAGTTAAQCENNDDPLAGTRFEDATVLYEGEFLGEPLEIRYDEEYGSDLADKAIAYAVTVCFWFGIGVAINAAVSLVHYLASKLWGLVR